MKTYTKTVREGENMGPIDWSYDFRSHFECMGTSPERRDEACETAKLWLKFIEDDFRAGRVVRATTYGGWPRVGVGRVLDVGMYDGWPYWKPTPSVLIDGHMGASWTSFRMITDVYPGAEGDLSLAEMERIGRAGAR